MAKPKYPREFLELCASVTGKRPKTVIDHILKRGHITTEELKNKYGYDHPPRAARDVRELRCLFPRAPTAVNHQRAAGDERGGFSEG